MEFVEWAKSELDRLVKDDDEMQKAISTAAVVNRGCVVDG